MTPRQAFPKTDVFLAAMRRPIGISMFSPEGLEAELDALVTFMKQAFGPLPITDEELLAVAGSRLAPVSEIQTALALLCPSELYLAMIGAEKNGLENKLLDARQD